MSESGSAGKWIVAIIVIALLGYVGWRYYNRAPVQPAMSPAATATSTPAPASTAARYPISAVASRSASAPPAPAATAGEAGGGLVEGLTALPGAGALSGLLDRSNLVPHVVATVDALPGRKLPGKILPLKPPAGAYRTEQGDHGTVAAAGNAERYAPYVRMAEQVDMDALVDWYVAHYDQFEQAYRQLGYPRGHFNDRVVAVIDHLLGAPSTDAPRLVRYKQGWAFADPELEKQSAGRKLLMRLPPADQARIKARLRELRKRLTGTQLPLIR